MTTKKRWGAGGLMVCAGCLTALSCLGAEPGMSRNTLLVEVDGVRLTLGDLEDRTPASLFQARNTFYEAHKRAIEELVDNYLIEREAQRQKMPPAALIAKQVKAASGSDPSDEALRVYYDGLDTKETFEAVRPKILDVVRQRREARAKAEFLKLLRAQAKVDVLLGPPRAPISLKDSPVRGSKDAPVMLVEYADYECPYCQKAQPALQRLKKDFPELAFAYKDVPLPMHARAQKASEAARCAGEQGRYWEFHDWLFDAQKLDLPDLKAHARELKLDGAAFDRCLDSGSKAAAVQADLSEAQALGLPGTPAFFVNGRLLNPTAAVTYEALRGLVEEELKVSRAAAPSGLRGQAQAAARE